jgi:predicted RNase H-like nuclease (RuvC/YqgF family)
VDNATYASYASIVIAIIGVVSAWLAKREATKAAKASADASMANAKTQAETDAYARARKMDIETIARQEAEIKKLTDKVQFLEAENSLLKARVTELERRGRRSG